MSVTYKEYTVEYTYNTIFKVLYMPRAQIKTT